MITRHTSRLVHRLLTSWRNSVSKVSDAARRIQRLWRRIPRPTNTVDPITLEPVPLLVGRPTEDGGRWFDLFVPSGVMYRYAADPLFLYMASQNSPTEPHTRHLLDRVALRRLDRLIQPATRAETGYATADMLAYPKAESRRAVASQRDGMLFFVEDDFRGTCNYIRELCTRPVLDTEDWYVAISDYLNIFIELCTLDARCARMHLEDALPGLEACTWRIPVDAGFTPSLADIIRRPVSILRAFEHPLSGIQSPRAGPSLLFV